MLLILEGGLHLRVDNDLSPCPFAVPCIARESAASVTGTLQLEGIHCRMTVWLLQRQARAADRLLWSVFLYDPQVTGVV